MANWLAEWLGLWSQISKRDKQIATLEDENEVLSERIELLRQEVGQQDNLSPTEKLVSLLASVDQVASAWFELASILADYMKVRGVQAIEVSAADIDTRLRKLFPQALIHRMRDDTYFLPTKEKGLEILNRDWTNLIDYIAQRRDCDKFATIFKAHLSLHYGLNCAVEVWSPWHSFILLMFSDGELLLEPQTDLSFKVNEIPTPLYDVNEVFA